MIFFQLLVMGAAAMLPVVAPLAAAQGTQAVPRQAPVEESIALANAWARLAAGHAAEAASAAEAVLQKYPRSMAAASLLVEAEIARGGSAAGLAAYERWLGGRKVEDGYLLRRAARALLWEAAGEPENGVEALRYLAEDDDADARAALVARMQAGWLGETRALARLGDEAAVKKLVDLLNRRGAPTSLLIQSLVDSRSPLAVPALTAILADTNHDADVAIAAYGLGTLQGKSAIHRLQQLYNQPSQPRSVRGAAAAALYQMGDMTGIDMLRQNLQSDVPNIAAEAARSMASQPHDGVWVTVVNRLLSAQDPVVRARAAELTAPTDPETARGVLEPLLSDPNEPVRNLAGKISIERVAADFGALRRFLRSSDRSTQVAAAGRILELSR